MSKCSTGRRQTSWPSCGRWRKRLRGGWGWTLFGVVWGLAAMGLLLKAFAGVRFPHLSTALYLGMGWVVLIAIVPLAERIAPMGLFWLVAGGVSYTLGVVFFVFDERWRIDDCDCSSLLSAE